MTLSTSLRHAPEAATLLIVEDEAIIAADLEDKLIQLGYGVLDATARGDQAVSLALTLKPDLVLMDIHLQGPIDGIVAAGQIRSQCDIPIVFLTAHSDPDTLERAKISEPFGYILKPFDERELHTIIEIALHKHRIEQALRESEARLQAIVETAADGIITIDEQGTIESVNKAAGRMFGYAAQEIVGHDVLRLMPDRYRIKYNRHLTTLLETGIRKAVHVRRKVHGQRKDGSEFPIELGVTETRVNDRIFFTCVIRDISQFKLMEDELRKADRSKDQFIATLAHELRNPLAAIRNAVVMLKLKARDNSQLTGAAR